ncbi:hypothetical protein RMSM_05237 [Rhodopirellula maiorica SM1]|uniref:Uncharacterized protein n=1 Tax=Rhodopirellula maiorica SM1 TaxID=1265738 RepID=M5REF7_9BACT|nr:hypothetical protein [Rhodopirellula maiorica]EMI17838.1 hypothetical protein RMSM_05237 [Rhodopirellula maiorica SM1]
MVYFTHDAPAKRLIIDLQTFELVHCTSIPDRTIEAFAPDGEQLASLQRKKLVWLNTQFWQPVRTDEVPTEWTKTGSAFHLLNERYVINSSGSLIDLQTKEIARELRNVGVADNPSKPPKDAWVRNCLIRADTSTGAKVVTCTVVPGTE